MVKFLTLPEKKPILHVTERSVTYFTRQGVTNTTMKAEKTERTTRRREQILEAAFRLSARRGDWSLADIAGEIGLSKTALYRHFRDRADIEEEMRRELFRSLLRIIDSAPEDPTEIRKAVVAFYRQNQGHLFATMMGIVTDPDFNRNAVDFLVSGSPRVARYFSRIDMTDGAGRERLAANLLINSVSILLASFLDERIDTKLQDELLALLDRGLESLALPTDGRLDELTSDAALPEGETGTDGGKILAAIARAIQKHGVTKTTIERIAEETGTAKSSLYFHYRTKQDMLEDLLQSETRNMLRLYGEKASAGRTFVEQLYVIMIVQANYLMMKPDLIPVFNWIRYETIANRYAADHGRFDPDEILAAFRVSDLAPKESDRSAKGPDRSAGKDASPPWDERILALALLKRASIISSTITIYGYDTGHDPEKIRNLVRIAFARMVHGEKES